MAMHFHFSKNKKQSQCSPKASHSGKNHQKSFHPSKSLQTSKSFQITKNHQKLSQNPNPRPSHPKTTPRTPPNTPKLAPTRPKPTKNTSQILRNHPIRQISGQNLTPLSANFSTAFGKFGNQSGTSRENPCTAPKGTKMLVFAGIWHFFGRFLAKTLQKVPNSTKKVPNPCKSQHFCAFWGGARIFPTGSRLVPNLPKAVSDFNFLGVKKTCCFGLKPAETRPNPSQSLGFLVIFPLD